MARILGIDYGTKRTGIAVTDPLQIIVNPLKAVQTRELKNFLKDYLSKNQVEKIVIGEPTHIDGSYPDFYSDIVGLRRHLQKLYTEIDIVLYDESYTSVEARRKLIQSEISRKKRKEKGRIDIMSAVLILQEYLGHI